MRDPIWHAAVERIAIAAADRLIANGSYEESAIAENPYRPGTDAHQIFNMVHVARSKQLRGKGFLQGGAS